MVFVPCEIAEHLNNLITNHRIKTRCCFIQNEQFCMMGQGDRNAQFHLHAAGEFLELLFIRQSKFLYQSGIFSIVPITESMLHDISDLFDGQDRYGIRVREPEFRMYLNDIPVQTQPGTEQEDGGLVQYECLIEPMTCEPGDTFRMTFTCRDEFGLAYEFTLGLWSIPEEEGRLEELPAEEPHRPVLIWD